MRISPISFCKPQSINSKNEKPSVFSEFSQRKIVPLRAEQVRANFLMPFESLKMRGINGKNDFCDTSFYRDLYTLVNAGEILRETFPEGTDIIDLACSNGEEAISIYSLINDKEKIYYNIYGYDKNPKVIDLANKGVHTVYHPASHDNFLLRTHQKNEVYKDVARCFHEIMEETGKPNYEINDPSFMNFLKEHPDFDIKYFKVKDEYKNNFKFDVGDVNDLADLGPEKVGAVFLRNAIYILTNNYALDELEIGSEETTINKEAVINSLVDKVYDKLLPGGIFVVGSNEKDHIYLADDFTPSCNTRFIDEYAAYIYKKSPLVSALEKNGRFEPVLYSQCNSSLGEIKVPTIWRKVK